LSTERIVQYIRGVSEFGTVRDLIVGMAERSLVEEFSCWFVTQEEIAVGKSGCLRFRIVTGPTIMVMHGASSCDELMMMSGAYRSFIDGRRNAAVEAAVVVTLYDLRRPLHA